MSLAEEGIISRCTIPTAGYRDPVCSQQEGTVLLELRATGPAGAQDAGVSVIAVLNHAEGATLRVQSVVDEMYQTLPWFILPDTCPLIRGTVTLKWSTETFRRELDVALSLQRDAIEAMPWEEVERYESCFSAWG